MPKNKTKKDRINYKLFLKIIKAKGHTLTSIANSISDADYSVTEKTIRRSKHTGEINPKCLSRIGKELNINKKFLSGELYDKTSSKQMKDYYLYLIDNKDFSKFPYFASEKEELELSTNNSLFNETIKHILMLYDISFEQYLNMPNDIQNKFLWELDNGIVKAIGQFFKKDELGRKKGDNEFLGSVEWIITSKEETENDIDIARSIRAKYKKNPPKGYKYSYFKSMSDSEIIDFDRSMQDVYNTDVAIDYFKNKYKSLKTSK